MGGLNLNTSDIPVVASDPLARDSPLSGPLATIFESLDDIALVTPEDNTHNLLCSDPSHLDDTEHGRVHGVGGGLHHELSSLVDTRAPSKAQCEHNIVLRRVFSKFLECTSGFKHLEDCQEYRKLQAELEELFEEEEWIRDLSRWQETTGVVRGIIRMLEIELSWLQKGQNGSKSAVLDGKQIDRREILACLHRAQSCFQRIMRNKLWTREYLDALQRAQTASLPIPRFSDLPRLILGRSSPPNRDRYYGQRTRGPCTKGTRVDILNHVHAWVENPSSSPVYWINGLAGTGKTTIAYSLCEKLYQDHKLAASFFCSRGLVECRETKFVILSIAYQLAQLSAPFRITVLDAFKQIELKKIDHSLDLQFGSLISQPLLKVKHTLPDQLVVVIDALDECKDKEGVVRLLDILLAKASELPVKFIVSSRPEPEIRGPMMKQSNQESSQVLLHEIDINTVRADIRLYLQDPIWSPLQFRQDTLVDDQISTLVERAGALFIYAKIAALHIAHERGAVSVGQNTPQLTPDYRYYKEIDQMYAPILQAALDNPTLNEADKDDIHRVLQYFTQSHTWTTIDRISELLEMDNTRVWRALQPFWSAIHVFEACGAARLLHPSFAGYIIKFLLLEPYMYSAEEHHHTVSIAQVCLDVFRNTKLRCAFSRLQSSYLPDSRTVADNIPYAMFHAARYWATYLKYTTRSLIILKELEEFLSVHLLLWIEIMNLKGCAHELPKLVQLVKDWVEVDTDYPADLQALINDCLQFTQAFIFDNACRSTLHTYKSILPLWPQSSHIAKFYAEHTPLLITAEGTAITRRLYTLMATWNFDTDINSPTYSPDGTLIAVGVGCEVLLLAEPTTGSQQQPSRLIGHSDAVLSAHFSPDGTRVVSGSLDKSIRVWDIKSGEIVLGPIQGHTGNVHCVAFSPNGASIASGSLDETIRLWDSCTGEPLFEPLTGYGSITGVKFSPDGQWMAACTLSGLVMQSTKDGRVLKVLLPNRDDVRLRSVDISPDGTRIASGSIASGVYVWDVESGELVLGPLLFPDTPLCDEPFASLSFSPDGSCLISSAPNGKICLWESKTGALAPEPVQGGAGSIASVSFSPQGTCILSSSCSKTLSLWSARNIPPKIDPPLPGHIDAIISVRFSPDGTHIVSGSADGTVYVWNAKNGEMVIPLGENHRSRVRSTYTPNGYYILSNSAEGLILLDSRTDHVVVGPIQLDAPIRSAVMSSDGTHIIIGSTGNTVQVLAANTGKTLLSFCPPITNQSKWVHMTSIASSPDGTHIAVGSMHYSFSIHDVRSGQLVVGPFDGHTNNHCALAFSPDGSRIVTGSFSRVEVRDTYSGEIILGPLEGHKGWVTSVEYSPDGTYIVSGSRDSSICVWNAQTGEPVLGPVKWHAGAVRSVRFSPDGTRIVSGSDDKTIRVTNIRKDLEFSPNSSTPTGSDWQLKDDGWVEDQQGRLLVWIPPDLRALLMWPRTELLISTKGWFRLNFADAHPEESWAKCYNSPRSSDDSALEFLEESPLPIASKDESGQGI
ncbi:unnamed protein product [Rhizoctonia solani]|uniref:NACHT domain-containing protein n=1 Tax=Rhizoctonia solani TaxID=456999 RepID=A0A8H3CU74_9AGAM|nr:unnamed protein product [Rhizoctonia solani]